MQRHLDLHFDWPTGNCEGAFEYTGRFAEGVLWIDTCK